MTPASTLCVTKVSPPSLSVFMTHCWNQLLLGTTGTCYNIFSLKLSVLALAAMITCHFLVGVNNRNLDLIILEAESPRSRCQKGTCLVRTLFLVCKRQFSCCVSCGRKRDRKSEGDGLWSLPFLIRTPVPSWSPLSSTHLNLITSQRPHLPTPSH